jgi:hypothetical protein
VLASEKVESNSAVRTVTRVFVEATGSWTQVGPDKYDMIENGLTRIRQLFVALGGTTLPSTAIGTDTYGGLFLAQINSSESDSAIGRVVKTYVQAGVLSKSQGPGPSGLPGTIRHEWVTWKTLPDALSSAIPGIIVEKSTSDIFGFPTIKYSSLATAGGATPIGETLSTFDTLVQINKPGELSVNRSAVTGGFIPYLVSKPPTKGQVKATATVKLLAAAPAVTKPTAYNLEGIYVSVLTVSTAKNYGGSKSTDSGGTTVSLYSTKTQVDQNAAAGYIFTNASGFNGTTQTYSYDASLEKSANGTIVSTIQNTNTATITLSGSTIADSPVPVAGSLIAIDVEPITLKFDGTAVYRVTEYKVPA